MVVAKRRWGTRWMVAAGVPKNRRQNYACNSLILDDGFGVTSTCQEHLTLSLPKSRGKCRSTLSALTISMRGA